MEELKMGSGRILTLLVVLPALAIMAGIGTGAVAGLETGASAAEQEVILYYFHGTQRCRTCRTIESNAMRAIETRFKEQLAAGALRWVVLNTDESANEHFLKDFQLVSSSLVVVEMSAGKVIRYDVLQDAWRLVRDESRFIQYVQRSVDGYLQ
jgi:hypothetical protein